MISNNNPFLHKGMELFWRSGGKNRSKIDPQHTNILRAELAFLSAAKCLADLQSGLGQLKHVKMLSGQKDRYSMQVNGNWRLTFTVINPGTGEVNKLDLEDYHGAGGAKKH
jgi:plasmid maintenance system killer protein